MRSEPNQPPKRKWDKKLPLILTAIGMAASGLLLSTGTLFFKPSNPWSSLCIPIIWTAVVVLHLALTPVILAMVWPPKKSLLQLIPLAYLILFFAINIVSIAKTNHMDLLFEDKIDSFQQPMDQELYQMVQPEFYRNTPSASYGTKEKEEILYLVQQGANVQYQPKVSSRGARGDTFTAMVAISDPEVVRAALETIQLSTYSPKEQIRLIGTAIRANSPKTLKLLFQHGVPVNLNVPHQPTPLNMAIGVKNLSCINIIIAAGADVNGIPGATKSPLTIAKNMNCGECVAMLLDAGAQQ